MKRLNRYLEPFIAVALVFLGSCSSISMDDLQPVERGMSTNDLFLMLERNAYKVFAAIDPEDGLEYQVRIFFMVTGTQTYDCDSWKGDVWIPQTCTHAVHEDFAFLSFSKAHSPFGDFFTNLPALMTNP